MLAFGPRIPRPDHFVHFETTTDVILKRCEVFFWYIRIMRACGTAPKHIEENRHDHMRN